MSTQQEIYLYRYFEAIYRTQVEYSVSLTCQIWQLGTLMYKKDNYVTVLGQMKSAISTSGLKENKHTKRL